MKNVKAFIKELTELSKKHGIIIQGCGCHGSPWLDELTEDEFDVEGFYIIDSEHRCLEWTHRDYVTTDDVYECQQTFDYDPRLR